MTRTYLRSTRVSAEALWAGDPDDPRLPDVFDGAALTQARIPLMGIQAHRATFAPSPPGGPIVTVLAVGLADARNAAVRACVIHPDLTMLIPGLPPIPQPGESALETVHLHLVGATWKVRAATSIKVWPGRRGCVSPGPPVTPSEPHRA